MSHKNLKLGIIVEVEQAFDGQVVKIIVLKKLR